MLCEKCQKKEATVHMTSYTGGKGVTRHLCDECFQKENKTANIENFGSNFAEIIFNIEKFANAVKETSEELKSAQSGPECPFCGVSLNKLRNSNGTLGCPECYRTFNVMIKDTLANIQNGTIHLGKHPAAKNAPSSASYDAEIKELQKKIQTFIVAENYEAAAVCRDRIATLRAAEESGADA